MTTLRNVLYSFPAIFVIFSAKSQENSFSRDSTEASILKLLLLDQKDISGSLWFVGLIFCLELWSRLFYTLLVEMVFFSSHTILNKWMTSLLLRYMW